MTGCAWATCTPNTFDPGIVAHQSHANDSHLWHTDVVGLRQTQTNLLILGDVSRNEKALQAFSMDMWLYPNTATLYKSADMWLP